MCISTAASLLITLYLPEEGVEFEDVPVGYELLGWSNVHFIEPSAEGISDLCHQ